MGKYFISRLISKAQATTIMFRCSSQQKNVYSTMDSFTHKAIYSPLKFAALEAMLAGGYSNANPSTAAFSLPLQLHAN